MTDKEIVELLKNEIKEKYPWIISEEPPKEPIIKQKKRKKIIHCDFLIKESQLGYTHDYFAVDTDADYENIQKLNWIEHRACWCSIESIAKTLKKKGFKFDYKKIEKENYKITYRREDSCFIELACGNY